MFVGRLPHQHKLVIAGNHDLSLHEEYIHDGNAFDLTSSQVDTISYTESFMSDNTIYYSWIFDVTDITLYI